MGRALQKPPILTIIYRKTIGVPQHDTPPSEARECSHTTENDRGSAVFAQFRKKGLRRTSENDRVQIAITHRKTIGVRLFSLRILSDDVFIED